MVRHPLIPNTSLSNVTEEQVRKAIGIGPKDLVETTNGLLDIFGVKHGKISFGFLSGGDIQTEALESFLERFK